MNTIPKIVVIISLIYFTSCKEKNPVVLMTTPLGNIEIELYDDLAPITVANFIKYVHDTLLNNGEFYRVVRLNNQPDNDIKIEVIQGGIGWDDSLPRLAPITHEPTNMTGILHKSGTISMARNEPGTASSEFFICISDQPELDFGGRRNHDGQGFAAFGKVTKGMQIIKQIHSMPDTNQFLVSPVKIIDVRIK